MAKSNRRRRMPAPFAPDPLADDRGLAKRKLRQLCRQVERALSTALADVDDEVLLDLAVTTVLPWPNASRLLVVVEPTTGEDEQIDRTALLAHLADAKGELREVVAGTIHRKRTPELCFEIFRPDGDLGPLDPDDGGGVQPGRPAGLG